MDISKVYEAIETIQNYCSVRENSFSMLREAYLYDETRLQMIERDKEIIRDMKEHSNKIHHLVSVISFRGDYSPP